MNNGNKNKSNSMNSLKNQAANLRISKSNFNKKIAGLTSKRILTLMQASNLYIIRGMAEAAKRANNNAAAANRKRANNNIARRQPAATPPPSWFKRLFARRR